MDKVFITKELNHFFYWGYGIEISQIREDLDVIEKLGATYVNIEWNSRDLCLEFTAEERRFETDEEMAERERKEQTEREDYERRERATLAMLKAKYENK